MDNVGRNSFPAQAVSLDLQAQVAAAVAAERFAEADALQGELDAANAAATALEAAQHFTNSDLGSALRSLSDLSAARDSAAAKQPPAHAIAAATEYVGTCPQQPPTGAPDKDPAEIGLGDAGEALEPGTKLGQVAAQEAARLRPGSASALPKLVAFGLSRQLTDERTLSGYITDSDSAAEVSAIARGDSELSSAQMPAAKHLQSAKNRETLSAGTPKPTKCLPSSSPRMQTLYAHGLVTYTRLLYAC